MPLMNRCCLIALTYEGRVSGLGVWNSCSFQLIFNYPGSHEGGYRRGRAGEESWRADNQPRNMAEVKLIKNRKWPPIIVVITQQLIYCWSMVKLWIVCLVLLFLVPLRWLRPGLERARCQLYQLGPTQSAQWQSGPWPNVPTFYTKCYYYYPRTIANWEQIKTRRYLYSEIKQKYFIFITYCHFLRHSRIEWKWTQLLTDMIKYLCHFWSYNCPLFQFSLTCLTWRMSHVILIDTLDHIRDLETYLNHCRDAINDIDEDLEMFNNMKDAEIMLLVQQRARHNQQAETRKQKIVKEIQTISEKIRNLTGTLESHNGDADIERVLTPSEIHVTAKERPQGLNVDV